MVSISEEEAREWYEENGIADTEWGEFIPLQKGMIGIEAIASQWGDLSDIRETGVPESAVLLYFNAETVGLNKNKVNDVVDLTSYVLQNTTSSHIKELFDSSDINVLSVNPYSEGDGIQIECEADESLFN